MQRDTCPPGMTTCRDVGTSVAACCWSTHPPASNFCVTNNRQAADARYGNGEEGFRRAAAAST
jgi:hypothetical protein